MKILMLGWEFPPHHQGGLGIACEGLIGGLTKNGHRITLVLPYLPDQKSSAQLQFVSSNSANGSGDQIKTAVGAYDSGGIGLRNSLYGEKIFFEVESYRRAIQKIVASYDFDIIHAHDWMTYQAGIEAQRLSKKPLIAQIHATEFDRSGGNNINHAVFALEKNGMKSADKIIAVSSFTKSLITKKYGIRPDKISVLHNGINFHDFQGHYKPLAKDDQVVLFLGRLTIQKGPDYFITIAKKILKYKSNVTFILVGTGDMEHQLINEVAKAGIGDKVIFTGFLNRSKIKKIYRLADVYVMPSVSEPFGIAPLEALASGTPAIISKQSGVSEVLNHSLSVNFWDTDLMANHILSILDHDELKSVLAKNGKKEVQKLSWDNVAIRCSDVYRSVL